MNYWVALLILAIALDAGADDAVIKKDVQYLPAGNLGGDATLLDIYAPAKAANAPVIIWIHGGGWRLGDKGNVAQKAQAFNSRGMVLVSVNYRLDDKADYQVQASEIAGAINWVHQHIRDYRGSPEKIFLMGHSAGAHLAALVGTDDRYLQAAGRSLGDLQGVILLDGAAYDIPRQLELAVLPRMKKMYQDVFGNDPERQRDASPMTHIAAGKQIPPFLILHVADRRDGRIQSEALRQKLKDAGVPAAVVPAEGKTHMTINREIGNADDPPTQEIFRFLEERLQASRPK